MLLTVFFFILGLCQVLLFYYLAKVGMDLVQKARQGHESARYAPPGGWPGCALIIPVSGSNPNMETALRSFLEQNYPDYGVYLVVKGPEDAAYPLAASLARSTPHARIVVAGPAVSCGQKNHNLLAGVKTAGHDAQVYVFCDSTHTAHPDFLRCLIDPIARGETAFATGYHQPQPRDNGIITVAYTLSVLFMRFLQGMPGLTQLWGGAMAMTREAFNRYSVANLWQTNIVDDCSLSARLFKDGVHARLCPAALLTTPVVGHLFGTWHAWLVRQILYLKFCMPGQWIALVFVSFLMMLPPVWAIFVMLEGALGIGGGTAPFLALCWLCFLAWILMSWRKFISVPIPVSHWLWAFFCAIFMFAFTSLGNLWTTTLTWGNLVYKVGKGGRVKKILPRQ